MSLDTALEKQIREAMERGDFDNLPGRGKPLDRSRRVFQNTPEDVRMGYTVQNPPTSVRRDAQVDCSAR
ncbi:MAG: DUF1992 domain-containing protein [Pyrinomonadaceae bacterium]